MRPAGAGDERAAVEHLEQDPTPGAQDPPDLREGALGLRQGLEDTDRDDEVDAARPTGQRIRLSRDVPALAARVGGDRSLQGGHGVVEAHRPVPEARQQPDVRARAAAELESDRG